MKIEVRRDSNFPGLVVLQTSGFSREVLTWKEAQELATRLAASVPAARDDWLAAGFDEHLGVQESVAG
jgi:hypothetical protein